LYGLTNKKDAIKQIAKKYCRQESFRQQEYDQQEEAGATQNGKLEDHDEQGAATPVCNGLTITHCC
jgi:hypothetical protein